MSVVRIPRKIKTFEYEGSKFGIRRLRVGEMAELTRLTSLYLLSTRQELKQVVEDKITEFAVVQGDLHLMHEAQVYLAKTAVIDLEKQNAIFFGDEKIEDVDNDFVSAAWTCYNTDDTVKVESTSDRPLEPVATPPATTSV
jgi:hypothetical protein